MDHWRLPCRWRGAATGIIENTINSMCALGATPPCITVVIGPPLRKIYQVGHDKEQKVIDANPDSLSFFSQDPSEEENFSLTFPLLLPLAPQRQAYATSMMSSAIPIAIADVFTSPCHTPPSNRHRQTNHHDLQTQKIRGFKTCHISCYF